jgi:hypothetical protein
VDSVDYVKRRALLELARLAPTDARQIAELFLADADPYLRQAAIDMVLAAKEPTFQAQALQRLSEDPIPHVREAARRALTS